jgi:hypothetical protein
MTNKILIVGFACLSLAAVAQSNDDKKQAPSSTEVASPRDAASGQASGKRMHKPITVTAEAGLDGASKEAGKPTNKSAADDWQAQSKSAPKGTPTVKRVAAGDVNGDGRADAAATSSGKPASGQAASGQPSGQNANVKSPRDMATGQASGKRAQAPAASSKDQSAPPTPKP